MLGCAVVLLGRFLSGVAAALGSAWILAGGAVGAGACTQEHTLGEPLEPAGSESGDGDVLVGAAAGGQGARGEAVVSTFVQGGLGEAQHWRGYTVSTTSEDSEISPRELSGSELCVSGTLGTSGQAWAGVGWHIAQEIDPETFEGGPADSIAPGGSGVFVHFSNDGGSRLRVRLQADEQDSEGWCAEAPPAGWVISWGDFERECWLGGGEVYDSETPIATVLVETYSESQAERVPFDFCVLDLGPAL